MNLLSDIIKGKDVKDILKHPWQKSLDEIWKRVNYDLEQEGKKPWGYPRIAKRIKDSGWVNSMDDLSYLVKEVSKATYPAKKFFALTKVKK